MSTVSIIIPAYNQGHYLGEAIQSALDQTYQDIEIIVVDDGSVDNTAEIVAAFPDPRVRYIYQENQGLSAARNMGIRNANGSFLTYLDSDDLFLPQKLSLLVAALENMPEIGFVAGQALLIDENSQPLGQMFDKKLPDDGDQLLLGNPLHVGSVLLRREWQEQVGFFDESLCACEDWDLWLRLVKAGCKIDWVAQPVSLYRFHRAQMTRDGSRMHEMALAVLDKNYLDSETLPEGWLLVCDYAYSNAYMRAAAQAYRAGAFAKAKPYLTEAARLNPELYADDAHLLSKRISAWADDARTEDRLTYFEAIYDNLPDDCPLLSGRRQHLAQAAMQTAWAAYKRDDFVTVRTAVWCAFRYHPRWLKDRGAISIFIRSYFHTLTPRKI